MLDIDNSTAVDRVLAAIKTIPTASDQAFLDLLAQVKALPGDNQEVMGAVWAAIKALPDNPLRKTRSNALIRALPATDQAMVDGVAAAIKSLPIRSNAPDKNEFQRLVLRQLVDAIRMWKRMDNPLFKPTGEEVRQKELDKLGQLAAKLSKHIHSMHSSSLSRVEQKAPHTSKIFFHDMLRAITDAAEQERNAPSVERLIVHEGKGKQLIATYVPPKKGGRNPNSLAFYVANTAFVVYEEYTGKRATITTNPTINQRKGNFIQFVKKVFAAAGIKADAANYAQQVCDMQRELFEPGSS